jgi:hypothetical protein
MAKKKKNKTKTPNEDIALKNNNLQGERTKENLN